MAAVKMVLALMLAVVVSRILVRLLPARVPLPMLQIALGAVLSYAFDFDVRLDPGIFFLVFIPPLLFLDGWRIPKGALFEAWRPIVTLAFGLVIFTSIGIGFLIDSLIPGMPLAVAFALAAILSPTDPVAVSAIARGTPIPSRLMHVLQGEALLNDASGLVVFRFAVMAAVTGSFSLADASLSFLRLAAGGLLIGVIVAWGASALYHWLARWIGEEPGTPILISILIPFAAYLAGEQLRASGVLAAAAAGISIHYANLVGRATAVTRMRRSAIWEMLQVALSGAIFILLGEQLPGILGGASRTASGIGAEGPWLLAVYVAVIQLALIALRFAWVWASLEGARLLALRRDEKPRPRSLRFLAVSALTGVKGAVTLAGILTLPMTMPDGSAFPARDLAVLLAMSVILTSLLIASIGIPALARSLEVAEDIPTPSQERNARDAAAEAAVRRIEETQSEATDDDAELISEAASRIIQHYRRRLDREDNENNDVEHMEKMADAERRFRIVALRAERDELYRLRLARRINDPVHRRLVREIDLMEASLSASPPP